MSDTIFTVSPEVKAKKPHREKVDYIGELRTALRRPIEATWLPRHPMIACDDEHALLTAIKLAFYDHLPLRLSPDAIWITLVRGFALHVNENAEQLRHRFVTHTGRQKVVVVRPDFFPGADNPWPEAFAEFRDQITELTGGMTSLIEADFSTTGPAERAVSHLMAMEAFQSYFKYEMLAGCGIPEVTLTGTVDDWQKLRGMVQRWAEFGLQNWVDALDPVLEQFVRAKEGNADVSFWKSMFRYNSGSGLAVMTGWVNVLFPYFKAQDKLYANPFLKDWKARLELDDQQEWRERWDNPQGIGLGAIPPCFTWVPLKVSWGTEETEMRLVGGLLGVSQNAETLEVEAECGWAVVYENPVDPLSRQYQRLEDRKQWLKDHENL